MADLKRWPMALNQPGYEYPAELFRAEHHDATSGGNGVGAPTALKVTAQQAPDGTVSILPGGATVKSTYAGADGQSYHARNFQPFTFDVPPTGSASGGRHDLIILRVCDPQYDSHPEHPGGEISAEEAANYDFWWFEIHQGRDRRTQFDFPHVKLAHIQRPPNTTVVLPEHIIDLREIANPQSRRHVEARNLDRADAESMHSGTQVFPTAATHTTHIPEWATRVSLIATWGTMLVVPGNEVQGTVQLSLTHPDGTERVSQLSRFAVPQTNIDHRFTVVLADRIRLPEKFRGQDVTVRMLATKTQGAMVYMDGASSYAVDLQFHQEVV